MEHLPARTGEARERALRRGEEGGSRRTTVGNLREDILLLHTVTALNYDLNEQQVQERLKKRHPSKLPLSDQLVLLRTPAASEAERGHQPEGKARARGGQVTLSGQINFLPTIVARDYIDRRKSENWAGNDLVSTIHEVEETPQTSPWGKFEEAIRRWESVMGEAPSPTKPDGRDGQHRLSSEFTEWMMGLPKGWITGHGLSRKDELKACGNGVVPQQAELALKILLKKVADCVAFRVDLV